MGWELFQHIEETRCGMFEPNSQRSARCHLSEMDLTRQGLVTFLRGEMCPLGAARQSNDVNVEVRARSSRAGLPDLVDFSDRGLPDASLRICALACVQH